MTQPEYFKELQTTISKMYDICRDMGWGDPFASGRIREIILANTLGHSISYTLHGQDAIGSDGEFREYKTQLYSRPLNGRYDVSHQNTWEEQEKYLKAEKISASKFHYFATFTDDSKLVEIYAMEGHTAFNLLLPKLKKRYESDNSDKKNQGLYTTLTGQEITANSLKIFDIVTGLDMIKEHEGFNEELMNMHKGINNQSCSLDKFFA